MSQVFVSYAQADAPVVEKIVEGLRRHRLEVWWDQLLRGQLIDSLIKNKINGASAVLFVWSSQAVTREFVKAELRYADTPKQIHVRIDDVGLDELPFPTNTFDVIDLSNWNGDEQDTGFQKLCMRCYELIGRHDAAIGDGDESLMAPAQSPKSAGGRRSESNAKSDHPSIGAFIKKSRGPVTVNMPDSTKEE